MTATWQLDVMNLDGTSRQAAATFESLTFSYVLDSPGSITADLPMKATTSTRTIFEPGQRELRVLRNGVLVWGGDLWSAQVQLRDALTVNGEGYLARLRRRNVMADLIYDEINQQQIMWNLIAHTQAQTGGDRAITQGAHAGSSITRNRDYCALDHDEILSSIDELAQLDVGCDYEITPSPDSSVNKSFKTYQPRKGADLHASVTLDQNNTMQLSYEINASDTVSRADTIGGSDCNPPESDVTDSTALTNFGLLQSFESIDSGQLRDVVAHNAETLRNGKVAHFTAQATFHEGSGATAWGAFVVGDIISLTANRGYATFSGQQMRVVAMEVHLEPPSQSYTTVTLDSVIA